MSARERVRTQNLHVVQVEKDMTVTRYLRRLRKETWKSRRCGVGLTMEF